MPENNIQCNHTLLEGHPEDDEIFCRNCDLKWKLNKKFSTLDTFYYSRMVCDKSTT